MTHLSLISGFGARGVGLGGFIGASQRFRAPGPWQPFPTPTFMHPSFHIGYPRTPFSRKRSGDVPSSFAKRLRLGNFSEPSPQEPPRKFICGDLDCAMIFHVKNDEVKGQSVYVEYKDVSLKPSPPLLADKRTKHSAVTIPKKSYEHFGELANSPLHCSFLGGNCTLCPEEEGKNHSIVGKKLLILTDQFGSARVGYDSDCVPLARFQNPTFDTFKKFLLAQKKHGFAPPLALCALSLPYPTFAKWAVNAFLSTLISLKNGSQTTLEWL